MPEITLSVLLITYNHEPFIETAIDSVLMQETDFDYEIIISEDRSTDGTWAIVERYAEAYPGQILLLRSERNLNDNTVMRRGMEEARGRFLALLDGDDFWTTPNKLQRQVEFLEAHPDCSSCFHNVHVLYEDGRAPSHLFHQEAEVRGLTTKPELAFTTKPESAQTLADLVQVNRIPTCAALLRTEYVRELPSWYDSLAVGDWGVHLVCAEHGDIAYLDEVMATYRVHPGGFWSGNMSRFRTLADVEAMSAIYDTFDKHLDFAFHREIAGEVGSLYHGAALRFHRRGEDSLAIICAWRSLRHGPFPGWLKRWRAGAVLVLSGLRRAARVGLEERS